MTARAKPLLAEARGLAFNQALAPMAVPPDVTEVQNGGVPAYNLRELGRAWGSMRPRFKREPPYGARVVSRCRDGDTVSAAGMGAAEAQPSPGETDR